MALFSLCSPFLLPSPKPCAGSPTSCPPTPGPSPFFPGAPSILHPEWRLVPREVLLSLSFSFPPAESRLAMRGLCQGVQTAGFPASLATWPGGPNRFPLVAILHSLPLAPGPWMLGIPSPDLSSLDAAGVHARGVFQIHIPSPGRVGCSWGEATVTPEHCPSVLDRWT